MSQHQTETGDSDDRVMKAFVAGWFAHARNPEDAPLLVEDAWHAYRLVESVGGDEQ